MHLKSFAAVVVVALFGIRSGKMTLDAAVGDAGLTPVPCPEVTWRRSNPAFEPLPGARAAFGQYEGGLYRVEIPNPWNGELVLWAHGLIDHRSADGAQLRVGFPGAGQVGQGRT